MDFLIVDENISFIFVGYKFFFSEHDFLECSM